MITIIKHPQSGTYYIGQPLMVEVSSDEDYSIQWQVLKSGTWTNIPEAVSAEYFPKEVGTNQYRVALYSIGDLLITSDNEGIENEDGDLLKLDVDSSYTYSNTATVVLVAVIDNSGKGYLAYIKSHIDFTTKDILQYEEYELTKDIEFSEKSEIHVLSKPNITDDDIVILKQGTETVFIGICENYSSDESSGYTIELKQPECFFDRQIFVGSQALIKSTGIEDFIKSEIQANWTDSGDTLLDRDYITITTSTHTTINTTVDAENGVYNLKTFLGNAREYYGIFLDFTYTDSALNIEIRKDSSETLPIDVTVTDVSEYQETYNIDVLAKLIVKWLNTTTEATSTLTYYLKTNRTITTNASDPDRADGIVRSKYIEKATAEEEYQEVVNEFSANTYEHKITFDIAEDSKAYPPSSFYVGRKASIKTKTGIKTSIITKVSQSSTSSFVSLAFGKLKVSLIDKLRSMQK